ncbi:MAG TPA: hypothetical protein VHO69_10555 [Phototrophicaceae bacterium]|nr:hypothetical protein [Phototrophicaceae bacterium]
MSIEGLMVSLVIFLAAVAFVASPFFQRSTSRYNADANVLQKQRERLGMYYERVLTNIRDLDEDFSTGKMQEADYQAEREEWVQRGIQVLKALDEIDQQHLLVPDADQEALDHAIDDAIERAIAQHRRTAH